MKNMTTTRSFLAAAAALALTLLAGAVQASGNDRSISMGADVLKTDVNKDNAATVYYASKTSSHAWRVIGYGDKEGNEYARKAGMLTLFSAANLTTSKFNPDTYPNDCNDYGKNPNSTSDPSILKATVDSLFNGTGALFSDKERAAVVQRTLETGEYSSTSPYSTGVSGSQTSGYLWPLSTAEALYLPSDAFRSASDYWWLRSPGDKGNLAAIVISYGEVIGGGANVDISLGHGVRPAFYLNLDSVLFTSAAVGGKISGAAGADALEEVGKNAGNEWKVTLKDDGRVNFSASMTAASAKEVTFSWEGAETGRDEWISAIIVDADGNVKYYGRIAQAEKASGTATVKMPKKFGKTDRLWVFNEQYNGDKKTDYASPLVELAALPDGTVGVKYKSHELKATELTAPLEWKLLKKTKKDRLPAGLKLSRAGKISGTPREAGTFAFTVQVTDSAGKSATKALLLTVEKGGGPAAPEGLVATPPTAQGMSDGTISGVDATMEWSADDGETWTECPEQGTIGGLAPGDYLVRYKATEKAGPGDAATVTVPESGAHVVTVRLIDGGDGGSVVVLELTSNGEPVAGMDLWAWLVPTDGGAEQGAFLGTTDEAGRLVIDVDALIWATGEHEGEKASIPAGTWRIRIEIRDADGELWTGVSSDTVSLPATSTRSGGGGCDAGLGVLALLALAATRRRR